MKPSVFRTSAVLVVGIVLVLETLLAAALTVFLVYEIVTVVPDSLSSAVGLTILSAIASMWIGATAVGFFRGKSFSRGSALVWQVLQGAIGLASNQGLFARPDIGSALLVPAVLVVVLLLFSKSVGSHLGDRPAED
jgi:hypothetical protein